MRLPVLGRLLHRASPVRGITSRRGLHPGTGTWYRRQRCCLTLKMDRRAGQVAFGYVVLRADDHCANKRECVDRPRCADDGPWCADDCLPPTCAVSPRCMYSTMGAERGPLVHTTTDTPRYAPPLAEHTTLQR